MENKKTIRNIIKEKRSILTDKEKELMDNIIFNKIIESESYKIAKVMFVYVSFQGEVDTKRFIEYALNQDKRICVPKIVSKKEGLKAVEINSLQDLKEGAYGILEPEGFNSEINKEEIDLILMPGVAFDKEGGRVGYGGGFYDRFLKGVSKDTSKIALAYDFQIFNKVPMEEQDVRIDGIITN